MSESQRIKFLRISYWAGAVFDALVLIPMLSPRVGGIAFGIPNFNPGNDYAYAMYLAASLMAGWVLLLIWADQKPLERKGVLLLTVFPVLVGLTLSGIYAVTSNLMAFDKMLPVWFMQGALVLLFGFSYQNARGLKVQR
jgi:hypothetical protein